MKVKKYDQFKWFEVKHKNFTANATISPIFGEAKIEFPSMSSYNKIGIQQIGYKKLRDIAEILNKIADIAEEEYKNNTK